MLYFVADFRNIFIQKNSCRYGHSGHATGRTFDGDLDAGMRWQAWQSVDSWKTIQVHTVHIPEVLNNLST
ncbi:MAG: hypothetical protein ABJX82_18590, partial [Paracoccaceae bacterium]